MKPSREIDTSGTQAGPDARRVEARSKALALQTKRLLDWYLGQLLEAELSKLGKKVRKGATEDRAIAALTALLARAGVREHASAAGKGWAAPPSFFKDYYKAKAPQVVVLLDAIRNEFRQNMGEAIARWTTENPGISLRELSKLLRSSLYLSGVDVANPPSEASLQALPKGFHSLTRNVYSRAMLIARTEMNQANNAGAFDSIKATGLEFKMWVSRVSDGGRGHQEMNGQVVPVDEPFVVPEDGTRLMHPGDPSGPVRHIVNCRCRVIAAPPSAVRAAGARARRKA